MQGVEQISSNKEKQYMTPVVISRLPIATRTALFAALVALQDGGMSVNEARRVITKEFGVTLGAIKRVEVEGLEADWLQG